MSYAQAKVNIDNQAKFTLGLLGLVIIRLDQAELYGMR